MRFQRKVANKCKFILNNNKVIFLMFHFNREKAIFVKFIVSMLIDLQWAIARNSTLQNPLGIAKEHLPQAHHNNILKIYFFILHIVVLNRDVNYLSFESQDSTFIEQ